MSAVSNPQYLFLDEPTTGVDPIARKELREILKELKNRYQTSSIFTTHTMSEAEKLCDRIMILVGGKLMIEGSVENLRSQLKGYSLKIYK